MWTPGGSREAAHSGPSPPSGCASSRHRGRRRRVRRDERAIEGFGQPPGAPDRDLGGFSVVGQHKDALVAFPPRDLLVAMYWPSCCSASSATRFRTSSRRAARLGSVKKPSRACSPSRRYSSRAASVTKRSGGMSTTSTSSASSTTASGTVSDANARHTCHNVVHALEVLGR